MARRPEQLDLLAWHPPRTVIPFPLASRVRKARATARTLQQRKTREGKQTFWARTIDALTAELRRHGCDDDEIKRQIDAFFHAVEHEMSAIPHQERRHID
jgi:hypothetical protein